MSDLKKELSEKFLWVNRQTPSFNVTKNKVDFHILKEAYEQIYRAYNNIVDKESSSDLIISEYKRQIIELKEQLSNQEEQLSNQEEQLLNQEEQLSLKEEQLSIQEDQLLLKEDQFLIQEEQLLIRDDQLLILEERIRQFVEKLTLQEALIAEKEGYLLMNTGLLQEKELKVQHLFLELEEHRLNYLAVCNSISWKMTFPFRKIVGFFIIPGKKMLDWLLGRVRKNTIFLEFLESLFYRLGPLGRYFFRYAQKRPYPVVELENNLSESSEIEIELGATEEKINLNKSNVKTILDLVPLCVLEEEL